MEVKDVHFTNMYGAEWNVWSITNMEVWKWQLDPFFWKTNLVDST